MLSRLRAFSPYCFRALTFLPSAFIFVVLGNHAEAGGAAIHGIELGEVGEGFHKIRDFI